MTGNMQAKKKANRLNQDNTERCKKQIKLLCQRWKTSPNSKPLIQPKHIHVHRTLLTYFSAKGPSLKQNVSSHRIFLDRFPKSYTLTYLVKTTLIRVVERYFSDSDSDILFAAYNSVLFGVLVVPRSRYPKALDGTDNSNASTGIP